MGKVSHLKNFSGQLTYNRHNSCLPTTTGFQPGCDNTPHTTALHEHLRSASSTNGMQPGRAGTAHLSLHNYLLNMLVSKETKRPQELGNPYWRESVMDEIQTGGAFGTNTGIRMWELDATGVGIRYGKQKQQMKFKTWEDGNLDCRLKKAHLCLGQMSDTNWCAEHILRYCIWENTSLLWKPDWGNSFPSITCDTKEKYHANAEQVFPVLSLEGDIDILVRYL